MAAFDKFTGAVVWETKGFGDNATYCTSCMVEWNGHRQVIGGTEMHVFGVDPETGEMKWNNLQHQEVASKLNYFYLITSKLTN